MKQLTAGDLKLADRVVVDGVAGSVLDERGRTIEILTARGLLSVSRTTPVRRVVPSEAALESIAKLAAAATDEPLPPAQLDLETFAASDQAFDSLPHDVKVALTKAARRRDARLDANTTRAIWHASSLLFDELAQSLNCTARAVRAMVRNGGSRPEPPRTLPDHDCIGAFTVERELAVFDPCNADRLPRLDGGGGVKLDPLLGLSLPALSGRWHGYIRHDPLEIGVAIAMFAVHEAYAARSRESGDEVGTVGVDSGTVMVFDTRLRDDPAVMASLDEPELCEDGLVAQLGFRSATADGDGLFRVRAIRVDDHAVLVRVGLSSNAEDAYFEPPPAEYVAAIADAAGKPIQTYSTKATFNVGDHVRHPSFGDGVVSTVLRDNKVEIAFREGTRLLAHNRR